MILVQEAVVSEIKLVTIVGRRVTFPVIAQIVTKMEVVISILEPATIVDALVTLRMHVARAGNEIPAPKPAIAVEKQVILPEIVKALTRSATTVAKLVM
jgi:hypothetical protein